MHKQHLVEAGNRKIYRKQKLGFVLIHIAYFSFDDTLLLFLQKSNYL